MSNLGCRTLVVEALVDESAVLVDESDVNQYHLEGLKSFTTASHKDMYQEEITHVKSKQVTREEGQLQLKNVKPENPLHDTLQGKIQVAESGKQALEKVHSQSQDLVLELELKTSADPAFKAKKTEMETVSTKRGSTNHQSEKHHLCCQEVAARQGDPS